MKRILLVAMLSVAVLLAPASRVLAGNQEWAVAGKIMAGLWGLGILHHMSHQHQAMAPAPAPAYMAPQPPPSAYIPQPPPSAYAPQQSWVDGHYVYQYRDAWVPGYWERVWVPPVYETRTVRQGNARFQESVLVEEGHWKQVWHEGYMQRDREQVFVPGHWE